MDLNEVKRRIEAEHAAMVPKANNRLSCALCRKQLTEEFMQCSTHGSVLCEGCLSYGYLEHAESKYPTFFNCPGVKPYVLISRSRLKGVEGCIWHKRLIGL